MVSKILSYLEQSFIWGLGDSRDVLHEAVQGVNTNDE